MSVLILFPPKTLNLLKERGGGEKRGQISKTGQTIFTTAAETRCYMIALTVKKTPSPPPLPH